MMRAHSIALLAFIATPAFADPINITEQDGSPAIEADGSSSTTVSVVGGAASVTVKGRGKLDVYTHSGTVSGGGSLGVPELGIELGGALGATPGEGGNAAPGEGGTVPGEGGVAQPGDAAVLTDAQGNVIAAAGQCAPLPTNSVAARDIALILDPSAIAIVAGCADDSALDASLIDAIEANAAMMAVLSGRGYGASDVLALDTSSHGHATLFVAAHS